jgi:hypothetical protein
MMRFGWILALSLALHMLLTTGLLLIPRHQQKSQETPVEVVYNDRTTSKNLVENKPFIADLQVPENMRFENNDPVNFSSKNRQRVLQETQAHKNEGLTKNRIRGPKFLEPFQDENLGQPEPKRNWDYVQEGLPVLDVQKELGQMERGESTISVTLPDNIATASFTALNTDRHLFYSFYSRLERQIYFRWAKIIDKAYDSFTAEQKQQMRRTGLLKTDLIIFLNPQGEFERAEIHSASGVKKIDVSPALAFQDARIFPNPPKEMVREDGLIHLNFRFTVDFRRVQ